MKIRKSQSTGLQLKVNALRAADLSLPDSNGKLKTINASLEVSLNGHRKKSRRKLLTPNPSWDEALLIPLERSASSQLLVITVWNRSARNKTYLGEVRLKVSDLFLSNEDLKTEPKWYKLFSSKEHHSFVTGSVLLLFEIVSKNKKDEPPQSAPIVKVTPPVEATKSGLHASYLSWTDSLVQLEPSLSKLKPDEQAFYADLNELNGFSGASDISDVESIEEGKRNRRRSNQNSPLQFLQNSQSQALAGELGRDHTYLSVIPKDDPADSSDALSMTSDGSLYYSDGGLYSSDANAPSDAPKKRRFRRKKNTAEENKYELRNRKVIGVLFIEIVSCSDLPPLHNFTRTTFDMDPFVVVTFGKKTFRTSWKRHTLNPIYNERLAFEIMEHEKNFNLQFSVLDKDHFSFHDQVANMSLPVPELMALSRGPTEKSSEESSVVPGSSSTGLDSLTADLRPYLPKISSTSSMVSDSDIRNNSSVKISENGDLVKIRKKKKFLKKRYTELYVDTSKFKTLDLALSLHRPELSEKHSPNLKIRTRFLSYENLRRDFWRIALEQYSSIDRPSSCDYIELISFLDALGTANSDEIVGNFFKQLDRSTWGGDVLTHSEIIECLEDLVTSRIQNEDEIIFQIDRCLFCNRPAQKKGVDIITHVAICASKDWSIVNKILESSYVTPQAAAKRWFTKVFIKLTYGKYQLGSNSANILVQDRSTGIIMEEKMSLTVRLGIRLLYKGLDKAKSKRIRTLLRKLSIKQGIKFDSPLLTADIESFIKFHQLDMSICEVSDPGEFRTFNDFFYRKLRPGVRPIEAPDNIHIVSSPADCRCTTFVSVDSATELWIKGRNFTLAKLFNGNFANLENTDLYNPKNCCVGIFRLAPQDYHRFHSPVDGVIGPIKYIEGEYYTVNPMAIRSDLDVYGENVRVIIPIKTEQFGTVVFIAVGAMMVGSTVVTVKEGQHVKRGEDIGYFKFGGSTVLLLFEKKVFQFDSDLVNNSLLCIETLVRVGQSIGHSPEVAEFERQHIEFSEQPKDFRLKLIRAITGGDLNDTDKIGSWESNNIKITQEDVEELIGADALLDDDPADELVAELEDTDEEGLIRSEESY